MRYDRLIIIQVIILFIILWNILEYTTLFRKSSGLTTNQKTISFIANLIAAIILVVLIVLLFYSKNQTNKMKVNNVEGEIKKKNDYNDVSIGYLGYKKPDIALGNDFEVSDDYTWIRAPSEDEYDKQFWVLVKKEYINDYTSRKGRF